jgi:NCS1 family nucleobase:cation symporter-1
MSTSPLDTSTTTPTGLATENAVPFDAHGIEPIPDRSRDCSPWELFWIWSGANIAPINWVLGALGITLGLSLVETLIVVVLGNVVGCAVFGVFNVIGHRTAVNQMVLGRAPFGLSGSVLPGVVQFLLTMGWVGVNTWVVLDLVLAILAKFGVTDVLWLDFVVAAGIMAIQLGLALYGFYAIRSFEKYTVPATVLVMAVMTVLAAATIDVNWTSAGAAMDPADKVTAVTQLLAAIGIGWGLTWIPYASDYSRFTRTTATPRGVLVIGTRHVHPDGVAGGAWRVPGQRRYRQ